jgi:hypothetical protein
LGLPVLVWEILAGVAALAFVIMVARLLRPMWPRWSLRSEPVHEDRDSVFTWRHLAAQIWAALAALLGRLRRRRPAEAEGQVVATPTPSRPGAESVRQAYRRVLTAARRSGAGRAPNETPLELEQRLASSLGPDTAVPLRELTELYDHVRYGQVPAGEHEQRLAQSHADAVVPMLSAAQPSQGRPDG